MVSCASVQSEFEESSVKCILRCASALFCMHHHKVLCHIVVALNNFFFSSGRFNQTAYGHKTRVNKRFKTRKRDYVPMGYSCHMFHTVPRFTNVLSLMKAACIAGILVNKESSSILSV